jgi:hypothetical protein
MLQNARSGLIVEATSWSKRQRHAELNGKRGFDAPVGNTGVAARISCPVSVP